MNEAAESRAATYTSTESPQPTLITGSRTLAGIFILAVLYTLYFASGLLMPLLVAILIALLLSPAVALFKRFYIPRSVSALLLLTVLVGPLTILAGELVAPAQKWASLLPQLSLNLNQQIKSISDAIEGEAALPPPVLKKKDEGFSFFGLFGDDEKALAKQQAEDAKNDENVVTERIKQGGLEMMISLLAAAPMVVAQLLTGLILILFLLIFGPGLFATFVTSFPKVKDKQDAISLVSKIQKELSRYIVTVSIINFALGLSTAIALTLMGMEDAVLWGALVGLLNFAPYIGSLIGLAVLSLAGLAQYGMVVAAFSPVMAYLVINLLESQFITPTVLGSKMRINPLIVMIWLLIWGWLWGAVGVLLAVPLLVCIKLILGQLKLLPHWIEIIETRG
jgi:predicted PurR-regulated permease PerM